MNIKILAALLIAYAVCAQVAFAQAMVRISTGSGQSVSTTNPLPTNDAANALASWTNTTQNIAATATSIALTAPAHNVKIVTSSGSAIVNINFNGAATTSNYAIASGGTFTYTGSTTISSVSVLGASALGTVSVMAY